MWTEEARNSSKEWKGNTQGTHLTKKSKGYIYLHVVLQQPPEDVTLTWDRLHSEASSDPVVSCKPAEHKSYWQWAAAVATSRKTA